MPAITVPALREAFVNIVVSSPRDANVPSTIIPSADKHDEIAATCEAACAEWQHLAEHETWVPAARQLATHLAAGGAGGFYAVRALTPAGHLVEIDGDYLLDVMRLRFALVFAVLPPALQADPRTGHAYARHWQAAFKRLLTGTAWSLNDVFIPGDNDRRPGDRTEIEVTLELGGYQGRLRHEMPPPAS
jgi:hypothetical protein